MSETGLEQAVAAPNTSAKSSIRFQFSGPFNPRPPETTISASAIVTSPFNLSTSVTFKLLVDDRYVPFKYSQVLFCSFNPKELDERDKITRSFKLLFSLYALFVKQEHLT